MTRPIFHWFLPTGGDDRVLGAASHGVGIGGPIAGPVAAGHREATGSYLAQVARAAEDLGFTGLLTPTGAHCQESWLVTAALIPQTSTIRFLVAFRPGMMSPTLSADFAATFQSLSGGRLLLNVVVGGNPAEQRGYGDFADHDARYDRAEEFLALFRRLATGEPVDHDGVFFRIAGARLRQPIDPGPTVYLGGSSEAGIRAAARQADVYLTWGEPPAQARAKIDRVREAADRAGRRVRFGIRLHVITRDRASDAWAQADRLIDGLDAETVATRQQALRRLDSVGQHRMLDLHHGNRHELLVAPNLWAGIGLARGGAGTALVGSHAEVAERIAEYHDLGIDEFILSGYPHLEEAYAVGEGVLPLLVPTAAQAGAETSPIPEPAGR